MPGHENDLESVQGLGKGFRHVHTVLSAPKPPIAEENSRLENQTELDGRLAITRAANLQTLQGQILMESASGPHFVFYDKDSN